MALSEAQRLNLEHVRIFGVPLPRSSAGYHCRVKGLSEFIWLFEDGHVGTSTDPRPQEGLRLVKIVGERLTTAGRAALGEKDSE